MTNINEALYFFFYNITILYFVVLGCYMLAQQGNPISTHGELISKRRMTRSVGIFMLIWALQCLIYLPAILIHGYNETLLTYDLCFLVTVMLNTPAVFVVMHAIVQKRTNTLQWVGGVALPFILLTAWHVIAPHNDYSRLPIYIAALLVVAFNLFLVVRYVSQYRLYVQRLKSEYSETTSRQILWSWSCFAGFVIQAFIYVVYQVHWSEALEYIYMGFSVLNATYLCYCTCRQRPIDEDVVEEAIVSEPAEEQKDANVIYDLIEQKLVSLCEAKYLFLDPELTRETLCLRLSINHTYLSMYFRDRGITFYQYVNSLRVDYAVKLMQDNPHMPIRKVSELSGFRSQTTFRKVFQEVMGCLPSEVKVSPKSL